MEHLKSTIEQSIEKFIDEIADKLDKETLQKIGPEVQRLQKKQEEGKLDLNDMKSVLKIYRNVIIPSAMVHEANKLKAITGLIDGSVGFSKPS